MTVTIYNVKEMFPNFEFVDKTESVLNDLHINKLTNNLPDTTCVLVNVSFLTLEIKNKLMLFSAIVVKIY